MFISLKNNFEYLYKLNPLSYFKIYSRHKYKLSKSFTSEKLNNRKLVRISGDSSPDFLQGLITNDIKKLQNGFPSIYTMFLNNKGRVLFDSVVYRTSDSTTFLLDCDSKCMDQLIKHLKLYKVRRKIDISPVDTEYSVWAIYDIDLVDKVFMNNETEKLFTDCNLDDLIDENEIIVMDPRLPALGFRALIKSGRNVNLPVSEEYKTCRYKLGVGEGVDELEIGQSFPLEINCDYLNGVSFDKGCYIGQELTARTYHTGVVRKRLMPLTFTEEPKDIPYNTAIDNPEVSKKQIGKFKGINGNHGLGLMRVSETLESKSFNILNFKATSFIPFWWPLEQVQQTYVKINK